jgi:hypothetical protein
MLPLTQTGGSGGGVAFPTFAYLMSPTIFLSSPSTGASISVSNLGINHLGLCLVIAPTNIPITTATINVVTPQSGAKINVGIYSLDGNTKYLDAVIAASSANAQSVTGLSFTFQAGQAYYIAVSSDTAGVVLSGAQLGTPTQFMLATTANPIYGSAANTTSGNVMPSTLGTVTQATQNIGAAVLFS